jgi:hypothetical protein
VRLVLLREDGAIADGAVLTPLAKSPSAAVDESCAGGSGTGLFDSSL